MNNIPIHVAIIPDGNRRWAKEKGWPGYQGHRYASEKTLPDLIETAINLGIKYITFWALSPENLEKRTKKEIAYLFKLIEFFLHNKLNEFKKKDIKIKFIGNIKTLPEKLQKGFEKAIEETKNNTKITLILAINYGGRDEIIRAIEKVKSEKSKVKSLTEENFSLYLDTAGIPDPDLIIRTGNEKRLSGFMLWQSEYSELFFSDLFFPDFTGKELEKAIKDYSLRQRRFGQ